MARKILIVEDDAFSAQVLEMALKRQGYETLVTLNGMKALQVLQEQHPDLVLLDLMLPGIDGYEVLNRIRSAPQTAGIPVIVVSAKSNEDDQQLARRIGANGYLTKPYQLATLYQLIQSTLEKSSAPSSEAPAGQVLTFISLPRADAAPVSAALALALQQRLPAHTPLLVADLRPYTTNYEQAFQLPPRPAPLALAETGQIQQWSILASQPQPELYVLYNLKGDTPLGGLSSQNIQLLCDTVLKTVRFALVEVPLQTSEVVLQAIRRARLICFVASADPTDIITAHSLLQSLKQEGIALERCAVLVRGTPLQELFATLPVTTKYTLEDPVTPASAAIVALAQNLLA